MTKLKLTCPECCYVALQKIKENRWKCEFCGTAFDFRRLRDALDMLVGRQFQEDFIDELLRNAKPEMFSKFGERAWKWTGKRGILFTLDTGNGWHVVMKGVKSGGRNLNGVLNSNIGNKRWTKKESIERKIVGLVSSLV